MARSALGVDCRDARRNIYGLRSGGTFDPVGIGEVVLSASADAYVLHAVPGNGGGVDRHVRDICAHRPKDCVLHIVREQCVFEAVGAERLIPIDYVDIAHAMGSGALGRPALIHAHSTMAPVRDRVRQLCNAWAVDYVVTLHDIDFAAAAVDVGDGEREARLDFVSKARARVSPSQFILNVMLGALGTAVTGQLIENAVHTHGDAGPSSTPVDLDSSKQFQVAVIGALGPHKGLGFLQDVVAALPVDVRVVIVGYADGQVTPGWLKPDQLWVHGAFEPAALVDIVRSYGVKLAFFPNRQPESYCYALSDAWCSGLPALGPASGAIGDRIASSGAGWTYELSSSPHFVARKILDCLSYTDEKNSAVRQAVDQLLPPSGMVERLGYVYEKNMKTTHTSADMAALSSVAATHLNGQFFRGELQRLSGDLAFARTQATRIDASMQLLTQEFDGRGAWIATLEKSLAETQAELRRVEAARQGERKAVDAAREDERARSVAARDQERMAGELARDRERVAAEATLHQALRDAAELHAKDRAEIESAREKERANSEAARARDLAEFEAALLRLRMEIDAARNDERALAQSLREQLATAHAQAAAAHASELAQAHALHQAARQHDQEHAAIERARELALAETARITEHAAHEQYAAKLQRDVNDTLAIAHQYEKKIARYEHIVSALPPLLRRWAVKRAQQRIGAKDAA
jgi:hypothetical protein